MTALTRFRAEKDICSRDGSFRDNSFRDSPDSPVEDKPVEDKLVEDEPVEGRAFSGFNCYPKLEAHVVTAALEPFVEREVVLLETSTGDEQPYFRSGRAIFELEGQPCALTLYGPTFETAPARVFVPFRDPASGAETCGAGRCLEADVLPDGRVLPDFNYACNPFRAYSERYRCPLPPAENRLMVPVYAGEKL